MMIEFKATANKDGFSITVVDGDGSHTMYGEMFSHGYKPHFENNDKEYFDAFENDYESEMYDRIDNIAWILYEIVKEIRFDSDDDE